MKNVQIKVLSAFLSSLIISCSTNKGLVKREKSDFGTIKYYVQTNLNDEDYKKRIVIQVADSVYYSIYPDRIHKRSKHHINLIYTLYYGEVPIEKSEPKTFQKLSELDSLALSNSDKVLDSLKWNNFKRWNGGIAFKGEVIYYHGFPKNGKFEPY